MVVVAARLGTARWPHGGRVRHGEESGCEDGMRRGACARCGRDVRKVVGVRRRVAQGRGAVGGCGQQGVAARMGCGAGRCGWWWLGRGRNGASRALRREVGRELPDLPQSQ